MAAAAAAEAVLVELDAAALAELLWRNDEMRVVQRSNVGK